MPQDRFAPYSTKDNMEDALAKILQGQNNLANDVKEIKESLTSRVTVVEKDITALKDAVSELRTELQKTQSRPTTSTASFSGSASSGFQPRFMTLKGWIPYEDFEKNRAAGLSAESAFRLVDGLKTALGDLKTHISSMELRGRHVYSFRINVAPTMAKQLCDEVKSQLQAIQLPDELADFRSDIKVTLEPPPAISARYTLMGKILRLVRKHAPDASTIDTWSPSCTVDVISADGNRIIEVARIDEQCTVVWGPEAAAVLGLPSVVQLRVAFAKLGKA